jgi:hypothetical protein
MTDAKKHRKPSAGASEEAAIVAFGREPMRDRKVRAETYAQVVTLMANDAPS